MPLIEVLNRIKKHDVDSFKIKRMLEEYERLSVYANDYISKGDIAVLVLYYHFPQKDEVHEDIDALLGFYMETAERMPMDDKKRLIDLIFDYLDHK